MPARAIPSVLATLTLLAAAASWSSAASPASADDVAGWQPRGAIVNVTTRPDGSPSPEGAKRESAISRDGRYVALVSKDRELAEGVLAGPGHNLYLVDRSTGTTQLVNVTPSGEPGGPVFPDAVGVSDRGEVVFASKAGNLYDGPEHDGPDVFVRDTRSGETSLVTVDGSGGASDGPSGIISAAITPNGRHVVFSSEATDLVPDDLNGYEDVFVRDRQLGRTTLVSVRPDGVQGNWNSHYASISANGQLVTFTTSASTLVGEDTDFQAQVLLRDLGLDQLRLVSRSLDGAASDGHAPGGTAIADDGSAVAFFSQANDMTRGQGCRGSIDVFVYDVADDEVVCAVRHLERGGSRTSFFGLDLDAAGRAVYFGSNASNLVPGDVNASNDVFRFDLGTERTTLVSVTEDGVQGDDWSSNPAVSADGRYVAFNTRASNLVEVAARGNVVVKRLER